MADIFISYSSADLDRVRPIAKAIEDNGWSVWWDRAIPPGKTYVDVIKEAIKEAKCVIVLWSNQSIKSQWVQEEAAIGKHRRILVPAKIDSVEPPLGFGLIQAADLTNWESGTSLGEFENFLDAISNIARSPLHTKKEGQVHKISESNLKQQSEIHAEHAKIKPAEAKPVAEATAEAELLGSRKKSYTLKFCVATCVVLLLIAGGWWWVSRQHEYEARQSMEKLNTQILNLENSISELEKLGQIQALYQQRDKIRNQIAAFGDQAEKYGLASQLENLQNRFMLLKNQFASKKNELKKASLPPRAPIVVFENGNKKDVFNGPRRPTKFTITQPYFITFIQTYHWNNGNGSMPGRISLKHKNGTLYGPWEVGASSGHNGAKNVNWFARPNITIPPGEYTVIDSEPETWSANFKSEGKGFVFIQGHPDK